ncbi:MAG: Maf family protein [Parafannyhessea sp.]|uniref:Maf family protein n=1 Tax=Parafannyhessea sp. TaxID=2847324 RepID=UPI003F074542
MASGSPRRRELLSQLGLAPIVRPSDIDETPLPGESPTDLVLRLARGKALACEKDLPPELRGQTVIAADTTVWFRDVELGKPSDASEARSMLRTLSGHTHHVSTGVSVYRGNEERSFVETSDVTFYELTNAQIDAYVASGEPMDKAGAYGVQGLGRLLVREIRGDYFNIVGLPVARLVRELESMGASPTGGTSLLCDILEGRHA